MGPSIDEIVEQLHEMHAAREELESLRADAEASARWRKIATSLPVWKYPPGGADRDGLTWAERCVDLERDNDRLRAELQKVKAERDRGLTEDMKEAAQKHADRKWGAIVRELNAKIDRMKGAK